MEINSSKRMGNVSLLIVSQENKIYLDHKENLHSNIHEISTYIYRFLLIFLSHSSQLISPAIWSHLFYSFGHILLHDFSKHIPSLFNTMKDEFKVQKYLTDGRLKLNANITVVKSSRFFLKTCHIEISVPVNSLNMTIQFIPLYCQYTTLVKIIVQIVHY